VEQRRRGECGERAKASNGGIVTSSEVLGVLHVRGDVTMRIPSQPGVTWRSSKTRDEGRGTLEERPEARVRPQRGVPVNTLCAGFTRRSIVSEV
jgi:hypothetical protein